MRGTLVVSKTANRIRLRTLRVLMRLSRSSNDVGGLLDSLPEHSLMPLWRNGLDPVPALGQRRAEAPVGKLDLPFGLRGWLVSGAPEVRTLLAMGSETMSSDVGTVTGETGLSSRSDPGGLGMADPPSHTRLRQFLTPHFTRRAVEQRAPQVSRAIDDALASLEAAGSGGEPVDLHQLFALRVPSDVIMDFLGIPAASRAPFHDLSTRRFDLSGGADASLDVIQRSVDLLLEIIARERRRPGPGLIGQLLREHPDDLTDRELAGLVDGVVTGGLETTASMLTLGTLVLLRDPELRSRVRNDDVADAFVEEVLRYLSVVQVGFPRFVRRDVELAGTRLLAGDVVVCSLSGANRDPRRAERHGDRLDPHLDTLDLDRPPTAHLAFGHGLHRCVGAELARLELRLAYPALLRRFPDLRLAVEPDDLGYRPRSVVFGVDALPVLLT